MKKILFLSITVILSQTVLATVIIVDNNSVTPQIFTDVQEAVNASSAYDTVMVKSSPTTYAAVTVSNPITIIGEGFMPNATLSIIDQIKVHSSNVTIIGVSVVNGIDIDAHSASGVFIQNVLVERCNIKGSAHFNGGYYGGSDKIKNVIFRNNVFSFPSFIWQDGQALLIDTVIFENNIFDNVNFHNWGEPYVVGSTTIFLRNNLFIHYYDNYFSTSVFSNTFFFPGLTNAILYNNIFYGSNPQGCTDCTFYNNVTFESTSNDTLPGGNVTNLIIDPKLVNGGVGSGFSFNNNYSLLSNSPCIGNGVGGSTIGITGGYYPFVVGEGPEIPIVDYVNISKNAVPQGTEFFLQFSARVRK